MKKFVVALAVLAVASAGVFAATQAMAIPPVGCNVMHDC